MAAELTKSEKIALMIKNPLEQGVQKAVSPKRKQLEALKANKETWGNRTPQQRQKLEDEAADDDENCSEILDGFLFLGNYEAFCEVARARESGESKQPQPGSRYRVPGKYSHIIKVTNQNHEDLSSPWYALPGRDVVHYDMGKGLTDNAESSDILAKGLPKAFGYLDQAFENGTQVLVHCKAGQSRSAAVVIAYLMYKFKVSFKEAHRYVGIKRPIDTRFAQWLEENEEVIQRMKPQIPEANMPAAGVEEKDDGGGAIPARNASPEGRNEDNNPPSKAKLLAAQGLFPNNSPQEEKTPEQAEMGVAAMTLVAAIHDRLQAEGQAKTPYAHTRYAFTVISALAQGEEFSSLPEAHFIPKYLMPTIEAQVKQYPALLKLCEKEHAGFAKTLKNQLAQAKDQAAFDALHRDYGDPEPVVLPLEPAALPKPADLPKESGCVMM